MTVEKDIENQIPFAKPVATATKTKQVHNEPPKTILNSVMDVILTEAKLWVVKVVFIFFGLSQSCFHNFIPIYFNKICNYTPSQMGHLMGMSGWCTLVGPPIWGAIADAIGRQRFVHNICIITASILIYLLYHIRSFPLMMAMMFLAYFQTAPVYSLLDQAVMKYIDLKGYGEYGRQRLFAALGNGIGAVLCGLDKGQMHFVFLLHVAGALCCFGVLQFLPVGDAPKKEDKNNEENVTKEKETSFLQNLKFLLTKLDIIGLLAVAAIFGTAHGIQSSFLNQYLENLVNSTSIVGSQVMLETVSEIPAFFFAAGILRKLGIVKVLLLSITAYVLRFLYYYQMSNAWSALPFALLHGINYSLTWAALTEFVFKAAPVGLDGTTMGLLAASYCGIGKVLGSQLGGEIANRWGYNILWLCVSVGLCPLALLTVIGLALALRRYKKQQEEIERNGGVDEDNFSTHSFHDLNDSYRRSSTFGPSKAQIIEIQALPISTPNATPKMVKPYTFDQSAGPNIAAVTPSTTDTPKVPYNLNTDTKN